MRPLRLVLPPLLGALVLGLGLAACTTRSEVVELEPGTFALTIQSQTAAAAARLGVDRARGWCAARKLGFEPVRTEIGNTDYRIAFRCPRPVGDLTIEDAGPAAPAAPQLPVIPGFRQEPGLL